MKKLLLLLLLLPGLLPAQTVAKKMFTIDAAGNQLAGVITTPADYASNPDSCAVLLFYHGVGEAGDGTLEPVEKIFNNGSPVGLAAAGNPMTYTDPISGKLVRFIIVGLQGRNGWCAYSDQGDYVLRNDILKNYRVSRNKVSITGLSAGGQVTWEAITNPALAPLYACAIPMSTPAPGPGTISTVAVNLIKVWAFHGTLDGNPTSYDNSVRLVGQVNDARKGLARLTSYNAGHCCWANYYDPAYKESIAYWYNGVKYVKSLNIYEFVLLCSKGNNIVFDTTAPAAPQAAAVTKAVPVVTISGTTATLDGTASTANGGIAAASWDWYCADSLNRYFKLNLPGSTLPYGAGTIPVLNATGFKPGPYTFRLQVQDKYGYQSIVTVSARVGGTPPVIPTAPPVVTKTIMGRLYLGGKEFVIYQDSAGAWSVDIN